MKEVNEEAKKAEIRKTAEEIRRNVKSFSTGATPVKEVIAQFPKCKKVVYENSKAYSCSGFKDGCNTALEKLEKLGKAYKADVVFNLDKNWIEFSNK